MGVVNPLPEEKTASELHSIYDGLSKKVGKMPNIFGLMAHRPEVLSKLLPFYSAVMEGGTVKVRGELLDDKYPRVGWRPVFTN